ncbi:MAG: hypothetical protein LUF78_00270 [Clostridiales bacterium]|nr:hypothetical protein [Clostridiales bacterium]MCD8153131.1 hypothetical protein [Clostridiales bacterium]
MIRKKLMNLINRVILTVLFRSLRVLYRADHRVHREITGWPGNLSLKIICGTDGPVLAIRKEKKKGLTRLPQAARTDISMRFKTTSGAFRVLTGQIGIPEAYAKHLFSLEGDINRAMSFVHCVEYAEACLFPSFWCGRFLREIPRKEINPLCLYICILLENGR